MGYFKRHHLLPEKLSKLNLIKNFADCTTAKIERETNKVNRRIFHDQTIKELFALPVRQCTRICMYGEYTNAIWRDKTGDKQHSIEIISLFN